MTRAVRARCGRHLLARALVCAFLVLLVVPIVHDEAGCPTTAPHSLTCTAHGMAAAPAEHVGGVLVPYLSDGGSVRLKGPLVVDTLLPSDQIGRSPPPRVPLELI